MGGEQFDQAQRGDAKLHAWASKLLSGNSLFDNSFSCFELLHIVIVGNSLKLELHRLKAILYCGLLTGVARPWKPGQIDDRVPFARHTFIKLYQYLLDRRLSRPHLLDRLDHLVFAGEILVAQRMRDILFLEDFPASALCSQGEKFWISPVHWNAEPQRQLFLPVSCVEGDKVGAIGIGDQRTYPLYQAWSFEQLLAQRTYRTIKGRGQKKPRTRMTRDNARQ